MAWWVGVASTVLGGVMLFVDESGTLSQVAQVVSGLTGGMGTSPAALILGGLGIIGIRDKLERSNGRG